MKAATNLYQDLGVNRLLRGHQGDAAVAVIGDARRRRSGRRLLASWR
jgi:hypothetical protein